MRVEIRETSSVRDVQIFPEDLPRGESSFAFELYRYAGTTKVQVATRANDDEPPSVRYLQALHDATGVALELAACMNDAGKLKEIAARVNAARQAA